MRSWKVFYIFVDMNLLTTLYNIVTEWVQLLFLCEQGHCVCIGVLLLLCVMCVCTLYCCVLMMCKCHYSLMLRLLYASHVQLTTVQPNERAQANVNCSLIHIFCFAMLNTEKSLEDSTACSVKTVSNYLSCYTTVP